ncbi:MAG: hypothetical protein IKW96_09655 [Ruminococcus sp.]|uniref:hypothetical protein n=1 Tax=Ruminococcus sp. TaxID=41978 RepID=UPI0025CF0A9E|nr:hypothetical protein [Ruminococcus sp.]MBR5683516.1 hypothetical protein [Ruminococcus sp.]
MQTNDPKGRALCVVIGVYLIAKAVLNMVIGGGFSFSEMFIAAGLAVMIFTGLKYFNYLAAAVLAVTALIYLPQNISNIGSNWLYLIEGVLDIGCAVLLCVQKNIRQHFTKTITINN